MWHKRSFEAYSSGLSFLSFYFFIDFGQMQIITNTITKTNMLFASSLALSCKREAKEQKGKRNVTKDMKIY